MLMLITILFHFCLIVVADVVADELISIKQAPTRITMIIFYTWDYQRIGDDALNIEHVPNNTIHQYNTMEPIFLMCKKYGEANLYWEDNHGFTSGLSQKSKTILRILPDIDEGDFSIYCIDYNTKQKQEIHFAKPKYYNSGQNSEQKIASRTFYKDANITSQYGCSGIMRYPNSTIATVSPNKALFQHFDVTCNGTLIICIWFREQRFENKYIWDRHIFKEKLIYNGTSVVEGYFSVYTVTIIVPIIISIALVSVALIIFCYARRRKKENIHAIVQYCELAIPPCQNPPPKQEMTQYAKIIGVMADRPIRNDDNIYCIVDPKSNH